MLSPFDIELVLKNAKVFPTSVRKLRDGCILFEVETALVAM